MTKQFPRKNIRLPALNYTGSGRFFITLCCERRRAILARPVFADRVIEIFRDSALQHGFAVYAYCLMPDHIHENWPRQDRSSALATQGDEETATAPKVEG